VTQSIDARDPELWFAVRVKSNREKVVAVSLKGKGYETFFPTYSVSQTARTAERPLFPGYVFSRFQVDRRLPILILPGVVHIVGVGKTPIPIDDEEMAALRLAIDSHLPITPVDYTTGEKVQVQAGPLTGATGTVSGKTGDRLIVSITLLQRSVAVELRPEWITRTAVA
jgi:transcription termination/antitermination protein NusG